MTTRVQHYLEIDNLRKKVDLILGIETICDNVNGWKGKNQDQRTIGVKK